MIALPETGENEKTRVKNQIIQQIDRALKKIGRGATSIWNSLTGWVTEWKWVTYPTFIIIGALFTYLLIKLLVYACIK